MVKVEQKVVLVVIDGWGIPSDISPKDGDAIAAATTPIMDSLTSSTPQPKQSHTALKASSLAVGLPEGLMGNSEVGHLNIGAGRVVWQDVVRIDQTIKKGEMGAVPKVKACLDRAKNGNGRLHFLGLVSDGGVHSHILHLFELLRLAKERGVPEVYVHFFGDGRDTDPRSGLGFLKDLLKKMEELKIGKLATIVGRYYIMDRDKRWERVETGMAGVVSGKGEDSTDPVATVKARYEAGETDEFLKPIIVNGQAGRIQDGDSLYFFNYRSDRVREITQLLGGFDRSPRPDFPYPKDIHLTTMTQYNVQFPYDIAFPPQHMGNVLAEWLSKQSLSQCHVAETEKYAHVTFFFNGGVEKQFPGEDRELIPSPKVATYDLEPKMSAMSVADKVCERIAEDKYEFLMNNFAPPDMVGHTGIYEAAIVGCTETDKAVGKVLEQCRKSGYVFFLTADHGNAEEMLNDEGKPKTSHTVNKVPFILANAPQGWSLKEEDGVLGDVAPTLLAAMGLPQPEEMSGSSLLVKK